MKKVLCLAGMLLGAFMTMQAVVVMYTPDNTTIFKNPEPPGGAALRLR